MKTKILLGTFGVVLALGALQVQAAGTTTPGSMLFTPTGNPSLGAQNSFVGTVGGVFLSSYSEWPDVNWLGYYDKDGDGLQNSHRVGLWDGSTLIAEVTVPAGTAAPLVNGYRWAQLPSTVGLWYNHWYTIGAQADGIDTWGDVISGAQVSWSSEYAELSAGYEWTRAGRYGNDPWPAGPGGQTSVNDSIYPAANMAFDLTIVPEPTSLAIIGLGALLYAGVLRRARA
jgi:hypothetical protein